MPIIDPDSIRPRIPDIDELPRVEFGVALMALKSGHGVTRAGWNGKGMFLLLQHPGPGSRMTLPYVYITTVQGDRVPWLASQTDILAEDWVLLEKQ